MSRLAHSTLKADPHWGQRKDNPFLSLKTMLLINTSFLELIFKGNGDADIENKLVDPVEEGKRVGQTEEEASTYPHYRV